jgi:hypothetical protein
MLYRHHQQALPGFRKATLLWTAKQINGLVQPMIHVTRRFAAPFLATVTGKRRIAERKLPPCGREWSRCSAIGFAQPVTKTLRLKRAMTVRLIV